MATPAFILPDTNVRTETEMAALLSGIEKESFKDGKMDVLKKDIEHHKAKFFAASQVVQVLKKLTFSSDLEQAVNWMNDYIVQLTCEDVKQILKCFTFSSDQLHALEVLKDLIADAASEGNRKIIVDIFTFSSDRQRAEDILSKIKLRRSPLWGKVTYNPVLFVLDISGSMDATFKTSDGQTRSRLNVSIEELISVLTNQLSPENSKFNIILYSQRITKFYPEPVLATPENKQAAINRLREFRAGGGTNTFAALTQAFATKDLQGIYLLSDGEPTDAAPDATVAAASGHLQSGRHIPITTIGFFLPEKNPTTRAFMQKLAESTGGLFRAIE